MLLRSTFITLLVALASCKSGASAERGSDLPEKQRADPTGEVETEGRILALDRRVPAAEDLEARLETPRHDVEAEMTQIVGRAARKLTRGKPEGLLGNFVCDVMRLHAQEITGQEVHMAWSNLGGLRADLPAGDLTVGSVLEVMPMDNAIVVFELKGVDVQGVLDRSASHGGDPVSGVRYRVDGRKAVDVLIAGAPLDVEKTYRLATNDYIIDGGGKYESVNKAKNVNRTGVLIRDAMLHAIQEETRAGREIDARIEGRVTITKGPQ